MVAEDDADIREVLRVYFQAKGHKVITADNGVEALEVFQRESPGLLLLDILLPRLDGWSVLAAIRSHSQIPIILLTALDDTDSVIKGLSLGADDYLCKPFEIRELDARIHALLRRTESAQEEPLQIGLIQIDDRAKLVFVNNEVAHLSPKEYVLLKLLASGPGRVFSPKEIIDAVWDGSSNASPADAKQYIHLLRHKIERGDNEHRLTQNVKGFGYRLTV
jgi:DNA-binding response OmpR family regulator